MTTTAAPNPNRSEHPEYLGDGVYVRFDGYALWLHVGSHDSAQCMALEPEVYTRLLAYVAQRRALPAAPSEVPHG